MKQEWPITTDAAAPAEQTMLPLALHEHGCPELRRRVEMILAGDAVRAFAEVRASQMLDHGHRPEDDLTHTIDYLPRQALSRLNAFVERTGRDHYLVPPAEQAEILLRYIDKAGALLIAARERLLAVPVDGGLDDTGFGEAGQRRGQ